MKTRFLILTFILPSLLGIGAPAYSAKEAPIKPYDTTLIRKTKAPILYVMVKSSSSKHATNKEPPRVTLQVKNILRGYKIPIRLEAVWKPFPVDYSWEGAESLQSAWEKTPINSPNIKSRWYVTGEFKEGIFYVSPLLRLKNQHRLSNTVMDLIIKSIKVPKNGSLPELEEEAARMTRLLTWYKELENSDVKKLADKADLVVKVGVQEMDPGKKMVRFFITRIIKKNLASNAPETIKLMGFPLKLYAHMVDYKKAPEARVPDLLLFLEETIHTRENGGIIRVYNPVSKTQAIQPASDKNLEALKMLIPTP